MIGFSFTFRFWILFRCCSIAIFVLLYIFECFSSAPQSSMQRQMRSKRTERTNEPELVHKRSKEQKGAERNEREWNVNKKALNRNWHACQPVARTQQMRERENERREQEVESERLGEAKEQEEDWDGEGSGESCVLIIIFSSSTSVISLHTDLCINYTVRPWIMILFELVALTLPLSLSRILPQLTAVAAAVGCRWVAPLFVFCLYHLDFISNINIFAGSLHDTLTRVESYQQRQVSIVS